MALAGNNNLLLEITQAPHLPSSIRHQNSFPNINKIKRLGSTVQPLQSMFPSDDLSTSISHPHLEQLTVRTSSTSAIPLSFYKAPSTYTSLCHLHDLYSKVNTSKISSQNNRINKSSDERIKLTNQSNIKTTVLSDIHLNEMHMPIEIRVRCIFLRVGDIDTLNERYTGEIFFEISWYAKDPKAEPQNNHFNPQLCVLNHIGDSLRHDKWYSINETNMNNFIEITEYHKFKGIFWERMELNHFPYDVQELSISLTSPLTTNDIYFIENKQKPSGVNRTVFSDQQSWHLYEHVEFSFEQHQDEYSLNYDQTHPVLTCTCHVGRKCGYYIWNAYFLIFLITSSSLCTFAIPPSNAHGRLQITCTLLLTSVTFRWVVNKSLPTISYLTALDVYAIASIVALCIINVFHGVISYLYYNQIYLASYLTPIDTNRLQISLYPNYGLCRMDRLGFYILSVSFCAYQISILLWTFWTPYKRRRLMEQKDEKNRTKFINKTELVNIDQSI